MGGREGGGFKAYSIQRQPSVCCLAGCLRRGKRKRRELKIRREDEETKSPLIFHINPIQNSERKGGRLTRREEMRADEERKKEGKGFSLVQGDPPVLFEPGAKMPPSAHLRCCQPGQKSQSVHAVVVVVVVAQKEREDE